ncbi:MAG: carboxypeptidase regulatory-like domain-containing protein, partial [Bacteroidales bacterium]|nr:carboxypeptidase regulatory-like domain-containing protein [Bacteroidales bacterium]
MKEISFVIIGIFISFNANTQITFQKAFGGSKWDYGISVQQTNDGGYIITGSTQNFGAGGGDVYLIKTDEYGDTLWTKTFGGSNHDHGMSVQQTNDGGYIITGYTESFGEGDYDTYLIKTDLHGDTLWTKTFGDILSDLGLCVQQTNDGGYIITGYTKNFGAGWRRDVYLIKTNEYGDTLWTKTFGGNSVDASHHVQQTYDGGYIISGSTQSFGAGLTDVYLIKTDEYGDTLWTKTFGGSHHDEGLSVQQTNDGGYIISGSTISFGEGYRDVYLIKTDKYGDTLWTKTFGGSSTGEIGHEVQQTNDGGYIITGFIESYDPANYDVYLIKTDEYGNIYDNIPLINGIITNSETGLPIENAIVYTTGYLYADQLTNSNGEFSIDVRFGYDYHVTAYANGYELNEITGINVLQNNPVATVNISLNPINHQYIIKNLLPNPNPDISTIMQCGTIHRYYYVENINTLNPGYDIEVEVKHGNDISIFHSNQQGIVDIHSNSSTIGNGHPGVSENYSIISVNGTPLDSTIDFTCKVLNPVYEKYWNSNQFGKLGVSFLSIDFEKGSSTKLIENDANTQKAEYINITRQARAGVGVNFSVGIGAGVQCGDIQAGANASSGVGGSISGITEDYYNFNHNIINNSEALAQYILIADGNFNNLDNTLIRFLSLLEDYFTDQTTLKNVYLGDKKGIDVCASASASANIGIQVNHLLGIGADANIGTEGHALLNIIYHKTTNE